MRDRPNILFLFSDQQRWDTVGCYGQALPLTPNLDRLAAAGVRFENAFTCQPVCGPARAALQTGRYPTEVGCHVNHRMLPTDEPTLAHWLGDAGYEVGYLGKWHLASSGPEGGADDFRTQAVPPERRGGYRDFWLASDVLEFTSHGYDGKMFDATMKGVEFPADRYRVDCLTDFAVAYLRKRENERPFFLFISYIEPHHQNDNNRYEGPRGSAERFASYEVPGDLVGTAGDWRANYPDYLGCVHSLDENVGRLCETLATLGLAEDTLIIYTSDHGSHFRTRNSEYKRSCHDGCLRIPMIMSGPGFRGGKVVEELVSLIDLPPTVVSAGGVAPPASMRGRRLQDLVSAGCSDWPTDVFAQISEDHIGRAIRTARWKYAVWVPATADWSGCGSTGSDRYVECFLYDLEADPHERHNLVTDRRYAAVRAELAARLKARMVAAGEAAPAIEPAPCSAQ